METSSWLGKTLDIEVIGLIFDLGSNPAELTDQGRRTMLNLGTSLRSLYIDRLGFMPDVLDQPSMVYLRTTPFSRTLDSLHQVLPGLYPAEKRSRALPPFEITSRHLPDETLTPNEWHCSRFVQLVKAFSQRAARRCMCRPEMGR